MVDEPVQPKNSGRDGSIGDGSIGTPRWVKIFGTVTALVIVLIVFLLLFGGGHGPSRHSAPTGGSGHTPAAGVDSP